MDSGSLDRDGTVLSAKSDSTTRNITAVQHAIPASYAFADYVDVGGLMSYAPDYVDLSRRAASYVDRILRGANPAELPVEQPTRFELVINLKSAKALGLAIPSSLLARADRVIQF
jgi:putative ABC transport system substrate-binding protein